MSSCRVCGAESAPAFSTTVLGRYSARYSQCPECGLLAADDPRWLREAYTEAISSTDTGVVKRNAVLARRVATLLFHLFGTNEKYVDLAGGYGLFTRLMRDIGFDFYWTDPYTENLFSRGFAFDATAVRPILATAFEVLEHLDEPTKFMEHAFEVAGAESLLCTTELYPGPHAPSKDWWYYAFETGQHISFYQYRTLTYLAESFGKRLISYRGLHLFTNLSISSRRFALLTGPLSHALLPLIKLRMQSLVVKDHRSMVQRAKDRHSFSNGNSLYGESDRPE